MDYETRRKMFVYRKGVTVCPDTVEIRMCPNKMEICIPKMSGDDMVRKITCPVYKNEQEINIWYDAFVDDNPSHFKGLYQEQVQRLMPEYMDKLGIKKKECVEAGDIEI